MALKKTLLLLGIVGLTFCFISNGNPQDLKQRIRFGQDLEKAGRWEEARQLYEELYRQNPNDITVFTRLKEVCLITRHYERALEIVEARRKRHADPNLDIAIGQIYYKMGKEDEAFDLWQKVLDRHHKNPGVYHMVASAMSMERLLDDAIEVYMLGRKKMGRDDLFVLNLVNLYGTRMNYDKSTKELIRYLRSHPNHISIVESYLLRYPMTTRVVNEVVKQIKDAISSSPNDLGLRRILVSFYLKAGHYQESFELAKEMEKLTEKKKQGESLFRFGQEAFRLGAPKEAGEAYKEILEFYSHFSLRERVLFGLAQCYEAQEKFPEAVETYQRVFDEFSNNRNTLSRQALYRKGIVQRDELFDLTGAIETFQNLAKRFPSSQESDNGQLAMGGCYISRGDLDQAEAIFKKMMEQKERKKGPIWIRAIIRLAESHYLRGRFEETHALLEELSSKDLTPAVMQDPIFNDGLKLRLFLQEHAKHSPEPLRYLARGEYLIHQHKYDHALAVMDSLLAVDSKSSIAADALFRRGEINIRLDRFKKGLTNFDTLLVRFPSHILADQALERIGWIYERMGDRKKALKRYETLLVAYPQSFQIDEIRRRIRELERE